MESDLCELYAYDLKALNQFTAEVEACCRRCNSTFVLGINRLVALLIFFFRLALDVLGQWCFAQCLEHLAEGIVITIKEETDGAAAGSGIIYYLCYQLVIITKIQLVAYANLTRRVNYYIPKAVSLVQLAKEEYFYLGTCLLLTALEARREYLGVVDYHHILVIEETEDVFKGFMFYLPGVLVNNHKAAVFSGL